MCLGEFNLTLDYTLEMNWAEFCIRLYAYNRMQKKEWLKVREVAWASTIGPHLDPKKLPKNKDNFMPLGEKVSNITDEMKERINQAKDEYLKNHK